MSHNVYNLLEYIFIVRQWSMFKNRKFKNKVKYVNDVIKFTNAKSVSIWIIANIQENHYCFTANIMFTFS